MKLNQNNVHNKRSIKARYRNHCCRGKAISSTYSKCVSVALVIQHAERMRRTILSFAACLAAQYFSVCLLNGTIFVKKVTEHKMCALNVSTTAV